MSQTETNAVHKPRRLKTGDYQRWRYQKRIKHPGPKLPSGWSIFRQSVKLLFNNKWLFGGIWLFYALISLVFVSGLTSSKQLTATKQAVNGDATISRGSTLVSGLVTNSNSTAAGSAYQLVIFLIVSLVIIWALRQVYGQKPAVKISPKTAFYSSTGPFVQFILVLSLILLQMIPFLIGSSLYALVLSNGLAVTGPEQFSWLMVFMLLAVWSFYMISASVFGLYIVTLPDIMPLQALRSAKKLVRFRRWTVMRKVLFLPVILFLITLVIMLPLVLLFTVIAQWIFFVLSLGLVIIGHSYLYHLYRELL